MNTINTGIEVFERGIEDLPLAVNALLQGGPTLAVIRGLLPADVSITRLDCMQELARMHGEVGKRAIIESVETAERKWPSSVMLWEHDAYNSQTLQMHIDKEPLGIGEGEYTWQNVSELAMSIQLKGLDTSWEAVALRSEDDLAKYLKNQKDRGYPYTIPGRVNTEQSTGDAILFTQRHRPTLHAVDVLDPTRRRASVFQLTRNLKSL